jgi:hypothetical protein
LIDLNREGCSSNLELEKYLSFCLKTKETQGNLCRDGQLQDFPAKLYLNNVYVSSVSYSQFENGPVNAV